MASITLSSQVQQSPGLLDGLREGIIAFIEGVQDGLNMARNYSLLSHMSSDELRKRGLTRGEVSHAVVAGCTVR